MEYDNPALAAPQRRFLMKELQRLSPQIEFPTLNLNANLPGGDPNTMASAVASPLERQMTTIAGIDSMVSQSGTGMTNGVPHVRSSPSVRFTHT